MRTPWTACGFLRSPANRRARARYALSTTRARAGANSSAAAPIPEPAPVTGAGIPRQVTFDMTGDGAPEFETEEAVWPHLLAQLRLAIAVDCTVTDSTPLQFQTTTAGDVLVADVTLAHSPETAG